MEHERTLKEAEIIHATGARIPNDTRRGEVFEVQLDGAWVRVDRASYERVKTIQESCA